ncbi:thioredoxin family protein [Singulisphaera sp. Ch08]|uniref:Thioredoxin family protein n=1 Tax=Singulisphaera sp. Ch08 TaxID=3120278 RepID=A0AAU7CN44_9BACT
MTEHAIVSPEEWIIARKELLKKEKELTRLNDELSRQRRQLPWVKVEKSYRFEGPAGTESLADLFDGRSQLIVYHFMFAPGWAEGCTGCSFIADHIDGANLHLAPHDVSLVVVSRAPLAEFEPFKTRMGWRFKWISSVGGDFNYDYHVSFTKEEVARGQVNYNYGMSDHAAEDLHGISVFTKDAAGDVFHTYSSYARGCDLLLGAHNYLDLTPKGRNETSTMNWVRHHDRYDDGRLVPLTVNSVAPNASGSSCCSAEDHA